MLCSVHQLPIATKDDLEKWATDPNRISCRRDGDCDCPVCSQICWDGKCALAVKEGK